MSADRLLSSISKSALVGFAFATVAGLLKISQLPADERASGLQDRAYRLHYNKSQNRTDLFSRFGAAAGGTASLIFVSPSIWHVLGGAAVGSTSGIIMHVLTNQQEKK